MRVPSTSGVTLALHDLGGDGEPLLLCHATGFCGRAYEPLAAALGGRFHVWALDLRGHGDSTPPADGDFAWTGMADDVLAAVAAMGGPGVHGVGHSMGGAALMLAAATRPGWLRSAYLYEPIVFPVGFRHEGGGSPLAGPARRRRRDFPSKAEVVLRYATRPPLHVLRADALAAYVEHGFGERAGGGVRLKCRPEWEARTFEAETRVTVDRIEGLDVPATVAVGRRTAAPDPARFAPGVVAALARAVLVEYPHLGHFGPLQDPVTVAEDVVAAAARAAQPDRSL